MKGVVLALGFVGTTEDTKNPECKLHFGPQRLVDFRLQKSTSISHCPKSKWLLKLLCLPCPDPLLDYQGFRFPYLKAYLSE